MGFIIFLVVLFLCVAVFVSYTMAQNMQRVVEMKGYTDVRVVGVCFWLGIIGYLYVIALPDLEKRRLLKEIAGEADESAANEQKSAEGSQEQQSH